jgi:hypothetical protein
MPNGIKLKTRKRIKLKKKTQSAKNQQTIPNHNSPEIPKQHIENIMREYQMKNPYLKADNKKIKKMNTNNIKELVYDNTQRTTDHHTIYLYINTHGMVETYGRSIIYSNIPSTVNHITHIIHGKLGCVNFKYPHRLSFDIPSELSRSLFYLNQNNQTNKTNQPSINPQISISRLNEGISSREFFELYRREIVGIHKCYDEEMSFYQKQRLDPKIYIPEEQREKNKSLKLNNYLHKSILCRTENNYDMYTYNPNNQNNKVNIPLKTYTCDNNDIARNKFGIYCLYASGGRFCEQIMQNIIYDLFKTHREYNKSIFMTNTNELLKTLTDMGYTQIYLMDTTCNSTSFSNELKNEKEINEFHSSLNRNRNARMFQSIHNVKQTRQNRNQNRSKQASATFENEGYVSGNNYNSGNSLF